jgi:hypothetical protein
VEIEGRCSCPVGFNCKHVAAVLLEVIAGRSAADLADSPSFSRARNGRPPRQPPPPVDILAPNLAAWIDELGKLEIRESDDYRSGKRSAVPLSCRSPSLLDPTEDRRYSIFPIGKNTAVRDLGGGISSRSGIFVVKSPTTSHFLPFGKI